MAPLLIATKRLSAGDAVGTIARIHSEFILKSYGISLGNAWAAKNADVLKYFEAEQAHRPRHRRSPPPKSSAEWGQISRTSEKSTAFGLNTIRALVNGD